MSNIMGPKISIAVEPFDESKVYGIINLYLPYTT